MTHFTAVILTMSLLLVVMPVSGRVAIDAAQSAVESDHEGTAQLERESQDYVHDGAKQLSLRNTAGADYFPASVCRYDEIDIEVNETIGVLHAECVGDDEIAVSICIWEEDGFLNPDDRVQEVWLYFPTGGSSTLIPVSYTFENIVLGQWCLEADLTGEFKIVFHGPCFNEFETGKEDVFVYFPPPPPVLIAPVDGATGLSEPVTLDWDAVSGADKYHLQVDDDNTFGSVDIEAELTLTAYDATGLVEGTPYYWRVRSHDACGWGDWSPADRDFTVGGQTNVGNIESPEKPDRFELSQNYPNPFNAHTSIELALPEAAFVKVEIFNIVGERVRQLVDEELSAGHKVVIWDGKNDDGIEVSSGIYIYTVTAGDLEASKKMVLIK